MLKKLWNTRQMFATAEKNQWNKVKDYINNDADITAKDSLILEFIAENCQNDLLDLCLTKGLDPKYRDCMLLDISLYKGNLEMINILIEHDHDIIEEYTKKPQYIEGGGLWEIKRRISKSDDETSKKIAAHIEEATGKSLDDILVSYKERLDTVREKKQQNSSSIESRTNPPSKIKKIFSK